MYYTDCWFGFSQNNNQQRRRVICSKQSVYTITKKQTHVPWQWSSLSTYSHAWLITWTRWDFPNLCRCSPEGYRGWGNAACVDDLLGWRMECDQGSFFTAVVFKILTFASVLRTSTACLKKNGLLGTDFGDNLMVTVFFYVKQHPKEVDLPSRPFSCLLRKYGATVRRLIIIIKIINN